MSTTHPSASTGHDTTRHLPRRVRWVFPSSIATPTLRGRHVFGRDPSCHTVLAGTEISRQHAEIVRDGPVLAIRDLESRNGVFINGIRCAEAALEVGDVLRCGEWIGVVVADEDPLGLRELSPGWYGGASLAIAAEPARQLNADLPIVVQGETGTGKEGMARTIHGWSARRGPFVAVNCAAVPTHLAEAELFGYRKGAFTGADKPSPGLFRAAHGGTLFLDEILELPPALQPKLLRVLEQREVLALGETAPIGIDVRIVAATQEPLAVAVSERRFRADLHARLDGLTVVLPPLRERREDIVPLFQEFLRQHSGGRAPALESKLVETIALYDWPLNVRELLLLARRLLAIHGGGEMLKKAQLPDRMLSPTPRAPAHTPDPRLTPVESDRPARRKVDDAAEFEALVGALRTHGGSVAKAAVAIGVSRARAYRLLAAHPDFSLEPANE
jgi:two-component system response regulator FlrC